MDTHIHTCLSPCAELDIHPSALVEAAVCAGLDAVAVCDHNSAENVHAAGRAGAAAGITVIPGMEITSSEEVHILGLLPDVEAALALQARIYRALPGRNDERVFGMQVVANENKEVLGFNEHLLSGATTLNLEQVVGAIHDAGGLAVASHVDREGFGLLGHLGMIPEGLALDALEISRRTSLPEGRAAFAPHTDFPLLCASDAHAPQDVGGAVSYLWLEEPTLAEIRLALAGTGGRLVLGGGRPMEDLALHILDIAHNSIESGATRLRIELVEDPAGNRLSIEVSDNGRGMDAEALRKAADPFYTTRSTRKVGMGLALLAQAAREAGGDLELESTPGEGTRVRAEFRLSHIDRAPVGDMETTLMVLFVSHPEILIRYRHEVAGRFYELDSDELRAAGADPSLPEGLTALRERIRRGEAGVAC